MSLHYCRRAVTQHHVVRHHLQGAGCDLYHKSPAVTAGGGENYQLLGNKRLLLLLSDPFTFRDSLSGVDLILPK